MNRRVRTPIRGIFMRFLIFGLISAVFILLFSLICLHLYILTKWKLHVPGQFYYFSNKSTPKSGADIDLKDKHNLQSNGVRFHYLKSFPALFVSNKHCPRYARQPIASHVGLGHRYANLVHGLLGSMQLDATFVFDANSFRNCPSGSSFRCSSYSSAISFLGLDKFITASSLSLPESVHRPINASKIDNRTVRLRIIQIERIDLLNKAKFFKYTQCNSVFEICEYCCEASSGAFENCWKNARGAFNRVRRILGDLKKQALAHSPVVSKFPVRTSRDIFRTVIISIHLRLGDIVLHVKKSFFSGVVSLVKQSLPSSSIEIYLFFNAATLPPRFEFDNDTRGILNMVNDLSEIDTLHHWCESDVLVATGSSFPFIAFGSCNVPVLMSTVPKEGIVGTYDMEGIVWLDDNGRVLPESQNVDITERLSFQDGGHQ